MLLKFFFCQRLEIIYFTVKMLGSDQVTYSPHEGDHQQGDIYMLFKITIALALGDQFFDQRLVKPFYFLQLIRDKPVIIDHLFSYHNAVKTLIGQQLFNIPVNQLLHFLNRS